MTYDVVLTTYDTVVGDDLSGTKSSKNVAKMLHACDWHRVVLDEGEQDERRRLSADTLANSSSQRTSSAMPRQNGIALCRL